jgi:hypothetical protein
MLVAFLAGSAHAAIPSIDLNYPVATIVDPAAGLKPVNTECAPGQIDINTASAAVLGSALRLRLPTVQLLIARRPWLKGGDIASVPGVTISRAAVLAPRLCTTQSVLPAATPLACRTGTGAVDLQTASSATIRSRLRVSYYTAAQIVATRPLPQDLAQVASPRIAGLPLAKLYLLVKYGQVCVTPAPMDAGGSGWRWATAGGGAVVTRNGFSLIVPPGRITNAVGAYISVTPLAPAAGGLPHMDAAIHGSWTIGTTTVAVRGPWLGTGADERPAVFHDSADAGTTLSIGQGTARSTVGGQPTVTALATSLSQFEFGTSTCAPPSGPGVQPPALCLSSLTDGSLHNAWLTQATAAGAASAASLTPQPFCPTRDTGVSAAETTGDLPLGLNCATLIAPVPALAGTVTWQIRDDAYASLLNGIASAGVVYAYRATDAQSSHTVVGSAEENQITAALLNAVQLGGVKDLFPGQSLEVTKRPSFLGSPVHAQVSVEDTTAWESVGVLVGSLADMSGDAATNVYDSVMSLQDCAHLDSAVVGCVKTALEQAIDIALQHAKDGSRLARVLGSLKEVFKPIAAGEIVASFTDAFVFQFVGGTDTILTNTPDKPTVDALGRTVFDECLSHDDLQWSVNPFCQNAIYLDVHSAPTGSGGDSTGVPRGKIARDPEGHAYFVNFDAQTIQPVADGGTYLCLARHVIVDWDADLSHYSGYLRVTTPASCDGSLPDTRPLAPADIATPVVLRQSDGTSWIVFDATHRYSIPNGAEFECWVNPKFQTVNPDDVWDQVPVAAVAQFPLITNASISNCGDPSNPVF